MVTKAQRNEMAVSGNPADAVETGPVILERRAETGDNARSKGRVTATRSLMQTVTVERSRAIADKTAIKQSAAQRLAEANDLYREGADKSEEARLIASKAAVMLYQARANGSLSADEVSDTLGQQFGFKMKSNGQPSKTPLGVGEDIRKRIVRLAAADDFINGRDEPAFFQIDGEAIDPETESTTERSEGHTIATILTGVANGDITVWTAYEYLADVKKAASEGPVNAAFNPRAIAKIAEALGEEGAAAKFAANRDLVTAYAALVEMITLIDEQAAELVAKKVVVTE